MLRLIVLSLVALSELHAQPPTQLCSPVKSGLGCEETAMTQWAKGKDFVHLFAAGDLDFLLTQESGVTTLSAWKDGQLVRSISDNAPLFRGKLAVQNFFEGGAMRYPERYLMGPFQLSADRKWLHFTTECASVKPNADMAHEACQSLRWSLETGSIAEIAYVGESITIVPLPGVGIPYPGQVERIHHSGSFETTDYVSFEVRGKVRPGRESTSLSGLWEVVIGSEQCKLLKVGAGAKIVVTFGGSIVHDETPSLTLTEIVEYHIQTRKTNVLISTNAFLMAQLDQVSSEVYTNIYTIRGAEKILPLPAETLFSPGDNVDGRAMGNNGSFIKNGLGVIAYSDSATHY